MNDPGVYYLFVYGSLRSGFGSSAYSYINRYFNLTGNAKTKGRLYDLGPYPAAIPADDESYVIGELYELKDRSEFDEAIGRLDDYEGTNTEEADLSLYSRGITEVICNGNKISAWIYWYNGDVSGKPLVASGDILEYKNLNK